MIAIYLQAFRLCHKKYSGQMIAWLLIALLEIPFYILMVFCFENLSSQVAPFKNGLLVVLLATICFFIHLLSDLNLFQCAMVYPTRDLQTKIFRHFLHIPPRLYPEVPSGELSNVLFSQITAGWFVQGIVKSLYYLTKIIALFIIIAYVSIPLGLVSTVPVFILVFFCRSLGQSFIDTHAEAAAASVRLRNFITDTLNGILSIKLFNTSELHADRTRELSKIHNKCWLRADFLGEGVNTLSVSLPQLVIPLFFIFGGLLIGKGNISISQLVSMYIILNFLNNAISEAGILLGYAMNYGGQLKVILDFLEKEQEGEDAACINNGEIKFENIHFSYRDRESLLQDINFSIHSGEKIALVGGSGIGKSSLFSLLRGMHYPDSGRITIGGVEVTHKNAISLRENIASVSQSAYLFDADVLFNLTLGKEKDMDEIHNVLRLVGLQSFIKSLPDGLHTHLGPNGFSMSGGEKVRLCLARAMLMDRKMLLLDEFTANIDSIREEKIIDQILNRMEDKTIIIISHRLSSVRIFSRIIYIADGKIAADGSHDELLKVEGYRALFGNQI